MLWWQWLLAGAFPLVLVVVSLFWHAGRDHSDDDGGSGPL